MTTQPSMSQNTASRPYLAIVLMMFVAFITSIDAVLVRILTREVHPFVIAFFRALFGFAVVAPWMFRRRGVLRSNYLGWHVLRAALKLMALISFFFAFAAAPLADVTAIAFTSPILVTLGAVAFLNETVTLRHVLAIALGFVGVVMIAAPGSDGIAPAIIYALAGAVLVAIIHLMLKVMSGKDPTDTLVSWNLLATVPLAAIPAIMVWTTPSAWMLTLLAVQGLLGAIALSVSTRAFAMADVSLIAPIDFLRLPFVAILAFALFHETAAISTWIGGTVIFASTILMANSGRIWRTSQAINQPVPPKRKNTSTKEGD